MAKFAFIYHGGSMPETEAEIAEVLAAWQGWLGGMGDAVIDGGNPVGLSSTVHPDRSVTDDGGANPASGYGFFQASDKDAAIELARGCPILDAGGTVEVAEVHEMED